MPKFTKREAVCVQIEGSIRAHRDGNHVCCITLAGAAEEAMPQAQETLFLLLRETVSSFLGVLSSSGHEIPIKAGDVLNFQRNWLKHFNANEPQSVDISSSYVMVRRALSRFRAVYGEAAMTQFMSDFWKDPNAQSEISRWISRNPDDPPCS